ncbi:MAG TPA: membrane protein insertion efficiency factor YidD [bacterium]|nr:membrane protein insertion efficiency factor YidD [bacterium]
MNILVRFSIALIVWYQKRLSLRTGCQCLHYPTCSEFAVLALQRHGLIKGWRMALCRVADCHPAGGRPYVDFP